VVALASYGAGERDKPTPEIADTSRPAVHPDDAALVRARCAEFIPQYWHNRGVTAKGNLNLSSVYRFEGEVRRYRNRFRDDMFITVVMEQGNFNCSVSVKDGQVSLGRVGG
jgi:hypothetical protein